MMSLHPSKELCHEIHVAENVLQDFSGLDCSVCFRHFGFLNRVDPNYIFCSAQCLSVGKHNLEQFNRDVVSGSSPTFHEHHETVCDKNRMLGLIRGRNMGSNRGGRSGNLLRTLRQKQNILQYYEASQAMIPEDNNNDLSNTAAVIKTESEEDQPLSNGFSMVIKAEEKNMNSGGANVPIPKTSQLSEKTNKGPQKDIIVDHKRPLIPAEKVCTPPILKDIQGPDEMEAPAKSFVPIVIPVSSGKDQSQGQSFDEFSSRRGFRQQPEQDAASEVSQQNSLEVADDLNSTVNIPLSPVVKKIWTMNDMLVSKCLENSTLCNVVFVWGITKYLLNANEDEQKLASLQQAVQEYARNAPALDRIPSVNDIVFAPYDDNEFFRAKITSVDQVRGTIGLLFIDYGDEKKIEWKDCREPQDEIMKEHPIYGVVFELSLNKALPDRFKKAAIPDEIAAGMGQDLTIIIENKRTTSEWTGKICISKSTRTFNDIINELIKETSSSKWTIGNVRFSENFKSGVPVYISYTWELDRLNLVASADGDNLENLQGTIVKSVSAAPGLTRTPQLDEIVIAPFEDTYYRARVTGIDGADIHVSFIDHGDASTVKVYELKEPTDEIMKHPVYGICMKILGIPAGTPWINTNLALADAMERIAHVDIESQNDPTLWIGQLRFGPKTWANLVNDAIKSQ